MSATTKSSATSDHAAADRALFDSIAGTYCKKDLYAPSRLVRRHRLRETLRRIPELPPRPTLLEVGCACGYSVEYLDLQQASYVGLDYANKLIQFATQQQRSENVSFITCDIRDYTPEQPFDVIFLIGVLHHFDALEARLSHMRSLLKPGGWLVANEPQSSNIFIGLARRIRGWIDRSYSSQQQYFAPEKLQEAFVSSGFADCHVWPQGLLSPPFAEVMLRPLWLMQWLSAAAVAGDTVLERLLGPAAMPFSWNVIAVGRRPLGDTARS